ncbi:hypothetical protein NLI96_g7957 [Meripilus lineatus]|uniref:Uncharacterized protein n=1 Tax=Meripilus lineatus TaxID=2056292 RepID=A0AAD5V0E8_9APHY|nr:hypothetical protein NLI96_g7957 [Physisporinus lineatus]
MTRRINKRHATIRHPDLRRRSIPPSSVKFRLARKILAHYMKTKDKEATLRNYAGCLVFDQSTGCLRQGSTNSADVSWMTRSDARDYVLAELPESSSIDEICEQFSRMKISNEQKGWKTATDSDSIVDIGDLPAHEVAKALEDYVIDDLCDQFSKLSLSKQEKEDCCTPAEFDIGVSVGSSGSLEFFSASTSFDFCKESLIVSSTLRCVASVSLVLSAAISIASLVDLAEVPVPNVANGVDAQVMKRLREPSFTLSFFEEDEWHTAADIDASWSSSSGGVSLSDCSIDNHGDIEDNSSSEPEDEGDSDFFNLPVRETGGKGIRSCRRRLRRRQIKNAEVYTLSNSDSVDGAVPWTYKARWSTRPVIVVAHSPIRIISDSADSIPAPAGEVNAEVEDRSATANPVLDGTAHSNEVIAKDACDNDEEGDMTHSCDHSVIVHRIDEGCGKVEESSLESPTTFARTMLSGLRKWLDPILVPFSSSPSTKSTEPEQWQIPPPLFFGDESESYHFISSIGYPSRPLPRLPVSSPPKPFYDDLD